ncbi:unnamed protein product [Paramecium primaurelia]|uniref:Uncharacterized protein n=1 Tax=Paramecium primaurelia TaxID=5886 RepID=A0A8S1NLN8_PARPR|nr:unnamed protein product [Paramecium primaurelia]
MINDQNEEEKNENKGRLQIKFQSFKNNKQVQKLIVLKQRKWNILFLIFIIRQTINYCQQMASLYEMTGIKEKKTMKQHFEYKISTK